MSDNNDDDGDGGEEKDDAPQPGSDGKLSQEDVKRIAAREKRDGKAAGRRELLKDLGLESEEDLKATITKHREAETSKLSDADKAKKQAEDERSAAQAERAATRRERFDARCERALTSAGCPEGIVEKAVKLVDIDWETSEDVPDLTVFKDAAEALKKDMPQLFTPVENDGGPKIPGSDPGNKPPGKVPADTKAEARGMLAQRHPDAFKQPTS